MQDSDVRQLPWLERRALRTHAACFGRQRQGLSTVNKTSGIGRPQGAARTLESAAAHRRIYSDLRRLQCQQRGRIQLGRPRALCAWSTQE